MKIDELERFLGYYNVFVVGTGIDHYEVWKGTMYCKQTLFRGLKTKKEAIKMGINYIIDNYDI